jgi:hypothetical protein
MFNEKFSKTENIIGDDDLKKNYLAERSSGLVPLFVLSPGESP